jgi:hypothetical protein
MSIKSFGGRHIQAPMRLRFPGLGSVRSRLVAVCGRLPAEIRAATWSYTQIQALAHIEHVRIGGDKLGSELAKKRQHFFPCRVDEYHFRQIDEKLSARGEARCQRASVFSIITGESAFQP